MQRCTAGALGTWIVHILRVLSLKDEFWHVVFWKLNFGDLDEQDYVFNYFLREAIQCFDTPPPPLVRCVNAGISAGDKRFKSVASLWVVDDDFVEKAIDDPWRQPFTESLRDYTETPATSEQENDSTGDPIPF